MRNAQRGAVGLRGALDIGIDETVPWRVNTAKHPCPIAERTEFEDRRTPELTERHGAGERLANLPPQAVSISPGRMDQTRHGSERHKFVVALEGLGRKSICVKRKPANDALQTGF